MSLKGTLEYAKLSITGFKAEVLLSEKLIDAIISELDKVEEMQKTLEWYADIENHQPKSAERFWDSNLYNDRGSRARQALKGDTNEPR